jgi:hypothetical protein
MALGSRDCPFPIVPWSEVTSWNSWGYVVEAKGSESLGVSYGVGASAAGVLGKYMRQNELTYPFRTWHS